MLAVASAFVPVGAIAQGVELVVDSSRGAAFLTNTDGSPAAFDAYQLSSDFGALKPLDWTSIADNYDADNDQSVDSMAPWFEIAGLPISLAEGSTATGSATLAPGQVVALGEIYDLSIGGGLELVVADGAVTSPASIRFLDLAADYDRDLDVDAADYDVFAATFGSTIDLRADGNSDGVVDAADYTVWRDSPLLAPATAFAQSAAIFVPEPTALAACAFALAALPVRRRRVAAARAAS